MLHQTKTIWCWIALVGVGRLQQSRRGPIVDGLLVIWADLQLTQRASGSCQLLMSAPLLFRTSVSTNDKHGPALSLATIKRLSASAPTSSSSSSLPRPLR